LAFDRATRRQVQRLDRVALGEARKLFATSGNVAARLESSTGLVAEVLPHPPQALPFHTDAYQPFVLSVNRLDRAKRIDLLIQAAAREKLDVVVAGEGPDRERLESLADGNVRFAGRVSEEQLADLYARCRAVYYAPVDEDFGMVPFEAFLSGKPVVTTTDAGGPLDLVRDRETGRVVEPTAEALSEALQIAEDEARSWGQAGKALAEQVTWDRAIERLLA
jgi:glycosyltransferase involved in cell wall biosynthesis